MKKLSALAFGLCALTAAYAQTNVGVSVGISQPGVYGQIDINNYPQPRVINQQPVIIMQSPVRDPVYLYVPPGHQKNWKKNCDRYNACGRPVFFVREDWVRERYEEDRRGHEGHDSQEGHGEGKGGGKDHKKQKHGDH